MSRMTKKQDKVIETIKKVVERYENIDSGIFRDEVKVYYDASPYNKRDYVVEATVSKEWDSYDTWELRRELREAGATNIIGCIRHAKIRDYIDWAFDIKESKLKELMEDE